MSNTDKNASEEVDLGILFNAIGRFFQAIISFITFVFHKIYSLIIYSLKIVIKYYKIIIPVIIISFLFGIYKESKSKPLFSSKMLVKTFFDSKYQLIDNLNYYNDLISNSNHEELSNIFGIDTLDIESLNKFSIKPGLETRNDQLKYYDVYLKEIDTSITDLMPFDEFIKNRDLLSGDLFEITVVSEKKDVFKKLEGGLKKSFANNHSIEVKRRFDSVLDIRKLAIESQISQINDLKETYLKVLEQESKTPNLKFGLGELPLSEQKSNTYEYELLNKEIDLRDKLRTLDEQRINYSEFYYILSNFQEVGSSYKPLTTNYKIVYPIYSLILLILAYLITNIIIYIKNYE